MMSKPHLPPALERFRDRFNQGAYWDSHEALEPEWRRTRSPFYHGLILYASAWVHHERKNPHGVQAQLAKAAPLLHPHAGGYLGVDVGGILRDSDALRDGAPPAKPQIALDPRRIRGDEPELAVAGD